jgi:hypothetical protein
MPCGVHRPVPCAASLDVVGWTIPDGPAHVYRRGYLGSYPLQSTIAFIEPLPIIEFAAQLLNSETSSRPLSNAERVMVFSLN